jgi:hypothetical protein
LQAAGSRASDIIDVAMAVEVKGVWLVTLRRYLQDGRREGAFEKYVASVPDELRDTIRDPVVSQWYPEKVMRHALEALYEASAKGDDDEFVRAMEECTVLGTHTFFKALLSVTSPRHVLKLLPTAVRHHRRGPLQLLVDIRDRAATLRFVGHPYSDHPQYRLGTPAIVRATMRLCVGPSADAKLVSYDATTQIVDVVW